MPRSRLKPLKVSYSASPLLYSLISLVILSLLLSASAAATQFVSVDRVTESFDTSPGGFTKSPFGITDAYATRHEGTGSELCTATNDGDVAYLSKTFASYIPTLGVKFWVDAISHGAGTPALNLSLAKIQFLNPTTVDLRIVRNKLGFFNAYFGGANATSGSVHMDTTKWYEINVYYTTDDDVARVYVTPEGGSQTLLASKSFTTAFKSGVAVDLGIFEAGSRGEVAVDYFRLYASPMLNITKPVVNAGDTITVSGKQFKVSSQVNLTIRSTTGQVVYTDPTIPTQSDGTFSRSVLLPSTLAVGLYYVTARQSAPYGEVLFNLGIWGLSSPLVNRTVPFNVTGYGVKPGSAVTINIDKVPPPSYHALTGSYLASSPSGNFVSSNVIIPSGQPLGQYKVRLEALGTMDYASYSFFDELNFTVVSAPLSVLVQTDATQYMRTQTVKVTALAKYRNGTTIPSGSTVLLNINVGSQTVIVNTPMVYSSTSGLWVYQFALPSNAPTGLNNVLVTATDISANTGSGIASFTVTVATIQAQFDFEQPVQRSETINISAILTYPDHNPVYQGTFNLVAKFGTTSHVASMRYSATEDRWKASATILPSDPLGVWMLNLVGADTTGNTMNTTIPFTVTTAIMSTVSQVDLNITYQRTSGIFFQVVVRYPSTQRMTTGTVNATITLLGGVKFYVSSLVFSEAAQAWKGYLRVPANAPEGTYNVVVQAVDPSGNRGNLSEVINVVKATLTVNVQADRREFQVGFDTVKFNGSVLYPDGTMMTNGSVTVEAVVGTTHRVIDMQQATEGVWTASMPTGFFDSGGEYSITVRASDGLGNSGSATFPLTASQLYVILSLVGVALALAIALALIWRFRQSRVGPPSVGVEYQHYL
jgi:hypothetical protein